MSQWMSQNVRVVVGCSIRVVPPSWMHMMQSMSWFWARPAGPSPTTAMSATICNRRQVQRGTVVAGVAGLWMSSSPLCIRFTAWWVASVMNVELPLLANDMVYHRPPSLARSGRVEDGRCCSRWLRKVWSCNSPDENKQLNKRLCSQFLGRMGESQITVEFPNNAW